MSHEPVVDLSLAPTRLSGGSRRRPRWSLALPDVLARQLHGLLQAGRFDLRSPSDDEHDLPFHTPRETLRSLCSRPPENLLMQLGQLPAHCYRYLARDLPERLGQPAWRLEEYEGGLLLEDAREKLRPLSSFARQEAGEDYRVRRQPGGYEGGDRGRRAGQHLHLDAAHYAGSEEAVARVGD